MERNRYLQLASLHAQGKRGVIVLCEGRRYHPLWYTMKPKKKGGFDHVAYLQDAVAENSYLNADLNAIEEVTG